MNESRHRRILAEMGSLMRVDVYYVDLVIMLTCLVLFSGLIQGFKWFVLFFLMVTVLIWVKLKSSISAFFVVSIFSLMFIVPNKYYTVQVISSDRILETFAYPEGYISGYGVYLSNVFLGLLSLALILNMIKKQVLPKFPRLIWVSLISGLGFMVIGFWTSIIHSPFLALSLTWLFQYSQVLVVALTSLMVYIENKNNLIFLYHTLMLVIFFQFVVSIWQFVSQRFIGLPFETSTGTTFFTGLDEISTLFRVAGTLAFHNQLALIVLVSIVIVLPFGLRDKQKGVLASAIVGIVIIVLTQSRSVWIASGLVMFAVKRTYDRELINSIKLIKEWRLLLYTALITPLLAFVIIPRAVLSLNAGYEGAGIPVRVKLFREGINALQQGFWTGYGVGTNEYVLNRLFPEGITSVFPAAVHTAYVQLMLEVGVIGFGFFMSMLLVVARTLLLNKNLNLYILDKTLKYSDLRFSFLVGLSAFGVYYLLLPHMGIFEFPYLGILLSLGYIAIYRSQDETTSPSH